MKKETKEPTFNKGDLVKSKRYFSQRDVLNVVLVDGEQYTIKQVDKMINDFLSKEVK